MPVPLGVSAFGINFLALQLLSTICALESRFQLLSFRLFPQPGFNLVYGTLEKTDHYPIGLNFWQFKPNFKRETLPVLVLFSAFYKHTKL